ncbi:Origin recognition complex subunit 4 [Monoraphidium neglectum]|uniref:Origin recognition complex subunit 4 n=1 Tax=Monoraphidium neglectum TaxID=145388 RepID=A0A0D2LC52_9CHLO|nr:Origin recognition complex subunit 4 [Monoraphidium neglectum]KIZ04334.1 Origin recognition complex subunit 4 [Monoraphidium neglectum]|eukprot:XP_013903353.1 Origin recognition complex subunit 4 [Monoraphidium neglectum]
MQSPLKRPRADTDHLKGLSQQQIEQQQQKQRQQQDQQRHGAQRDDNLRQGLAAAPANFKQAAIDHLVARIRDPRSADAAVLPLRPALAPLERELAALLSNVVIGGQNVSLLVIGEPGSGKTLLLERVLGGLCREHNSSPANPTLGVVRLHGALHGDERAAFQEIARQLCATFGCTFSRSASYDDNLGFLKDMLLQLRRALKCVVFVIDEVEAYVRVAKQMVLYNLLDALTSSQVQAAVLGVTCQWDVQDAMEKRVRSRFSSRRVLLPPLDHTKARRAGAGAGRLRGCGPRWLAEETPRAMLQHMLSLPEQLASQPQGRSYERELAMALDSAAVKAKLKELSKIGVCPRDLAVISTAALSRWQLQHMGPLGAQHLLEGVDAWLRPLRSRPAAVAGMSALQLGLLVAAQRLEDRGQGTFNFEMVFDEFLKAKNESLGPLWRKPAAWRAFRDVASTGLVQFTAARAESKGLMQQHCAAQLLLTRAELDAGIQQHPACPDHLKRWARGDALGGTGLI